MSINDAIGAWTSLRELAGNSAKVHITGGEPFLYFDHLANIMTVADKFDLGPLDLLETNGYWAKDVGDIADKLEFLDSKGLERLKISWDPFHAEYIDRNRVLMLVETANQVLGPERVLVRWEKYLQEPVKKDSELTEENREELYKNAVFDYPVRFTGRAAGKLADLFADKNAEAFSDENCKGAFLGAKGVHIDPYGNVFNGQCSGIIIGNLNDHSLDKMWENFDPDEMAVIGTLFEEGPCGLLEEAEDKGYERKAAYASKCHLCSDIRQFFFDNRIYSKIIGPCDCYGVAETTKEKTFVTER
ncbi:MAG: hypothetical protein JW912_02250 [Sedimentisphaerales bacterium]|nr:hypothetical protein [Sedimentisphaerales bacterium]